MAEVTYVLLHSPLAGPLTWRLVGEELRAQGRAVILPALTGRPAGGERYWQVDAQAAARAIREAGPAGGLILVGHSGAGPLLPAIRQELARPVAAYLFVDAGIPQDGASRLALMRREEPEWAARFERYLRDGGLFPAWTEADLRPLLPEERLRRELVASLQPRALPFFREAIPVFAGWPDAPAACVQFSPPYAVAAEQAEAAGWPVRRLDAGHFHMLVDPAGVSRLLQEIVAELEVKVTDEDHRS